MPLASGGVKKRPGVLIAQYPPFGDWLICGITSSLGHEVRGFDILIDTEHPDRVSSGLEHPGLIRIGFLSVVPEERIEAVVGRLSSSTIATIVERIKSKLPQ